MTRWAHLTWQAAEPAVLAADLGRRLGAPLARHPRLRGSFVLGLGRADLEVVPWRREGPADEPRTAGRLVFEPIEGGTLESPLVELPALLLAGVGWSTVELDRAESELEAWLEPVSASGAARDGAEPHLGGRTRTRDAPGLPGDVLVLCEPLTEGRLARSLARDGEGPCTLYLWPSVGLDAWAHDAMPGDVPGGARGGGSGLATADGPFGRSVLLPGTGFDGPFVILVEQPQPSSGADAPGTIGP